MSFDTPEAENAVRRANAALQAANQTSNVITQIAQETFSTWADYAKRVTERRVETWDSATLAPEMAQRLLAPGKDPTVLLPLPGETIVASVVEVLEQPTPAASRVQFARQLIDGQRSQQILQGLLHQRKSSAKIRYNPRFAPR